MITQSKVKNLRLVEIESDYRLNNLNGYSYEEGRSEYVGRSKIHPGGTICTAQVI